MAKNKINIVFEKGGVGSGHRGHSGRPGKVGGSVAGSISALVRSGGDKISTSFASKIVQLSGDDSVAYAAQYQEESKGTTGLFSSVKTNYVKVSIQRALLENREETIKFINDYTEKLRSNIRDDKGTWLEGSDADRATGELRQIITSLPNRYGSYGIEPYGSET